MWNSAAADYSCAQARCSKGSSLHQSGSFHPMIPLIYDLVLLDQQIVNSRFPICVLLTQLVPKSRSKTAIIFKSPKQYCSSTCARRWRGAFPFLSISLGSGRDLTHRCCLISRSTTQIIQWRVNISFYKALSHEATCYLSRPTNNWTRLSRLDCYQRKYEMGNKSQFNQGGFTTLDLDYIYIEHSSMYLRL